MSKPLATKVSTPLSKNVQIGPKVSIICVATIISQHCLNPLGHGVHQSSTGCHWSPLPLLHDDITELVMWLLCVTRQPPPPPNLCPLKNDECMYIYTLNKIINAALLFLLPFFKSWTQRSKTFSMYTKRKFWGSVQLACWLQECPPELLPVNWMLISLP